MDSSWSPDVCLHCEQPASGNWCSEYCRLANLDTTSITSSKAASPSTLSPSAQSSNSGVRPNRFYLPPALEFPPRRTASPAPTSTGGRPIYSQNSSFSGAFPGNVNSSRFTSIPPPPSRALTPSTSRSSLSSISSSSSQRSSLSDQAQKELRIYSNSFDLIRNWKRRMASN